MEKKALFKLLERIFKFAGFCLIIYIVLIIAWGELIPRKFRKNLIYPLGDYGHMYSRLREVKKTEDIDLLFLGSSHTYRGFDPRIFEEYGINSFNLGSNGQTPLQANYLLKKYLDQLSPKLVIYEVYCVQMIIDGLECTVDILANEELDWGTLRMVFKTNKIEAYNTLVFDAYRELSRRNIGFVENQIKDTDTYISGGFVEKQLTYNQANYRKPQTLYFLPKQINALKKNIEFIQSRNIEVVLVQAPITKARYASFLNTHVYDSIMNELGQYYNYNEILSMDDSLDYYDPHHLNQNGVKKFNHFLIESLKLSEKF